MEQSRAYALLGLKGTATKEQVKKAYRERCKKLHPDDNPSKEAKELYLQVQEAYAWIIKYHVYYDNNCVRVIGGQNTSMRRTGKVIGGWPVTEVKCSDFYARKKQSERMEADLRKRRQEEAERKKKIQQSVQNARKLPSEREAEKRRRLEQKKEAERIAEIIKQLWLMELRDS